MLHDTGVVFRRQMRLFLRNPAMVLVGLLQPVLYLLLFAPLLGTVAGAVGVHNKFTLFVPGLLVQLAVFGPIFSGYGLIGEMRDGVVEAERVTPASRSALLLGRLGRDMVQLMTQVAVLLVLAYLMGMDAPLGPALVGVIITLFLGLACGAASNAIALGTGDERGLGGIVNTFMMPVLLLSGILIPMQLGPDWLKNVARFMPVKYVVDGSRSAFLGDLSSTSVAWGAGWSLVLCVIAVRAAVAGFVKDR